MRHAAVAAVVRDGRRGAELLFIRRAEHPGDPWSGHMAFPGGRVEPSDGGPLDACLRETQEELGLDLTVAAEQIGQLSDVPAIARGSPVPLVIFPFVFALAPGDVPPLTPNYEVQEAVWIPLAHFAEQTNRSTIRKSFIGIPLHLPAFRWRGRIIWGLTLKMVEELVRHTRTI